MSLLFRIVYAAHANGTHHKIALDALTHLAHAESEAWQRVFLKHADLYLEGSKAPDTEFKDFKNHVLHVRDGFWGGAPEKAESWYAHLVDALGRKDWPQAAYTAGVLSHYYSDPLMPFHTAQSEAENAIHRAAEWSINRSYDRLYAEGKEKLQALTLVRPGGSHWLKDFVIQGAEASNPYYEKLIAHYDIHQGVVDPPSGLDSISRSIVAELLVRASKGFALILEQAIADSKADAPDVSLSAETVIAALRVPLKVIQKRLADAADRRIVEAMYDELKATGKVEEALPEDDRIVRDLYQSEVLAPREAARAAERMRRLPEDPRLRKPSLKPHATEPPATAATTAPAGSAEPASETPPAASGLSQLPAQRPGAPSLDDDVEAAPSIGPKMSERLATIGVKTIRDLLNADAHAAAMRLGDRRVTEATIRDWQDQTRLVMTIPGLRGGHAQLFVGAGFRSVEAIAGAEPDKLCADLLAFATTPEGHRILRDGHTPDIERIKSWATFARTVKAA